MITSIIINGILIGLIYALLAIGLTVIFGVMRIINMFHGESVMLGMYAAFVLFDKFGISPYISVFLTAPVFFVLGAIIYKFLIDPIPAREREITSLIITLGISFIFATSAMYIWSADYRTVTLPFSQNVMVFLQTRIGYPALISSCMSAVLIVIFYLFMSKTYMGRAIRATELDKDTASIMGVNVKWISIATFGIGVVLAAMAGGILSPIFYIYPFVGGNFVIKAFTIVVLGGMGSVTGALLGGVILGVAEALASTFLEYSMKDIMAFILFLGILLFKPSGILGGKTRL
ncbi:MAG: branched-chain amino acid ABC transporter permease [Syntrophorhabdus sp.]|jgi:branched-chain amino acid transport system permease protein|nr:branched-chain amino acid ABC transporter permease [Syntrophorhabdus sp.]